MFLIDPRYVYTKFLMDFEEFKEWKKEHSETTYILDVRFSNSNPFIDEIQVIYYSPGIIEEEDSN